MSLQGNTPDGLRAARALRLKKDRMKRRRARKAWLLRQQKRREMRGGAPQFRGLKGLALGVIGPEAQTDLDARMTQLDTTDQQVNNEISEAYSAGVEEVQVENWQLEYDALYERLFTLQVDAEQLEDAAYATFALSLADLQLDYEEMLGELFDAREGRRFRSSATGLAWGLGVAAGVAGILFGVYRYRGKRR
jgi:hypothetical protein